MRRHCLIVDDFRSIRDGPEHNRSMQGPDTEAQDHPPFVQFVQIQLTDLGRAAIIEQG